MDSTSKFPVWFDDDPHKLALVRYLAATESSELRLRHAVDVIEKNKRSKTSKPKTRPKKKHPK